VLGRLENNLYIAPNSLKLRAASFEVVEAELGEQVYSPLRLSELFNARFLASSFLFE